VGGRQRPLRFSAAQGARGARFDPLAGSAQPPIWGLRVTSHSSEVSSEKRRTIEHEPVWLFTFDTCSTKRSQLEHTYMRTLACGSLVSGPLTRFCSTNSRGLCG
jgi:hypothetical protein